MYGRLIFDIGCNAGQWIKSNYRKDIKFVGVEANPIKFKEAKYRFMNNDNVEILNYVVSSRTGEMIKFYPEVNDPSGVASTASEFWRTKGRFSGVCSWPKYILKPSISLNSLIDFYGKPEFIKIDVEGYEVEVLKGLSRMAGMIAFEWVNEQMGDALMGIDILSSLGYRRFAYLLNGDTYDYRPTEYMDYYMIRDFINGTNKDDWGMVYADL